MATISTSCRSPVGAQCTVPERSAQTTKTAPAPPAMVVPTITATCLPTLSRHQPLTPSSADHFFCGCRTGCGLSNCHVCSQPAMARARPPVAYTRTCSRCSAWKAFTPRQTSSSRVASVTKNTLAGVTPCGSSLTSVIAATFLRCFFDTSYYTVHFIAVCSAAQFYSTQRDWTSVEV